MKARYIKGIFSAIGLLLLILDTKTAVEGIRNGIMMCMQSAIPSLLPFLILTKYLMGQLNGTRVSLLKPLGNLCGIPQPMVSILGIGLIGGYPVGAQLIADAWKKKLLDKETAARMLGFCNNAGPAFIFGMCAGLFTVPSAGWLILFIQIFSALSCGIILPRRKIMHSEDNTVEPVSFVRNLEISVRAMLNICCCVLCFRVIISYVDTYLPMKTVLRAIVFGLLELVNGCISSQEVSSEPIRFIIINGMLSFGGMCVWMQTVASVKGLPLKWFYIGKLLQCLLCVSLASVIQFFIFRKPYQLLNDRLAVFGMVMLSCIFCGKKVVAFWKKVLYDKFNKRKTRWQYAVSQKN